MTKPALRTVSLLDREPGKAYESREVAGVKLEKGIPLPPRVTGKIDAALMALEIGESFEHTARMGTRKKLHPKKFVMRKQPNGKYRVWRTV